MNSRKTSKNIFQNLTRSKEMLLAEELILDIIPSLVTIAVILLPIPPLENFLIRKHFAKMEKNSDKSALLDGKKKIYTPTLPKIPLKLLFLLYAARGG